MKTLFKEDKKEDIVVVSQLDSAYLKEYERLINYIDKHYKNVIKAHILKEKSLEEMKERQFNKAGKIDDFSRYLKQLDKTIDWKTEYNKKYQVDYEAFVLASIWEVFTAFIVLLFFKALITGEYLITFSVDVIPAIICFYLCLRNWKLKKKIVETYEFNKKLLWFNLFTLGFCMIIKMITPTQFDITLLILALSFVLEKRNIKNEFEKIRK